MFLKMSVPVIRSSPAVQLRIWDPVNCVDTQSDDRDDT